MLHAQCVYRGSEIVARALVPRKMEVGISGGSSGGGGTADALSFSFPIFLFNFPFHKILKIPLECRKLIAKIQKFRRVQCVYGAP